MKTFLITIVTLLLLVGCSASPKVYNDGVYEGTADGKYGPITMSVTIASDKIVKIETVSHTETPGLTDEVFVQLPDLIKKAQKTEGVDSYTGATETSVAIFEAVNKALDKAKK